MRLSRLGLFSGLLGLLCALPVVAASNADGIPSVCDAVPGNLVANCGFETGDYTDWVTTSASVGSDFGLIKYNVNSGTFAARFGALDGQNDYIDQHLPTIVGHSYKVSFYVDASRLNLGGEFVANWDGTNILTIIGQRGGGFQLYSFTLTATSNNTDLQFGGYSEPAFYYLDDVMVTDTVAQAANLRAWGDNSVGELGNNTNSNSSVPVPVSGIAGVVAIAGGFDHNLALASAGTVWAWGDNQYGELGNGTNANSSVPVWVSGFTGAIAVATGANHSLALTSDGTVWAWGANATGALGNGGNGNLNAPVQVSGLSSVVAIAGGGYPQSASDSSLALKSDGTVWAWGDNQFGELGNGSTSNSNVPVQVSGLSGVVAIAGGAYHSLALTSDGTVWAWGDNQYGQLGNGTNANSNVPVQVTGLTGVIAVQGGFYYSLALKSDGTVWAWGYNGDGELGNGTLANSNVPVQVEGLAYMVAIAAGGNTGLALSNNGTVWAWGANEHGEIGDGSQASSNEPARVNGLTGAVAIAGGSYHNLAALGGGVPTLNVSHASLSFTSDEQQTVTVTNGGVGPLRIGSISVIGANSGDFGISGSCSNSSLAPAASCTLTVAFGATAQGSRTAAILIVANAPGSPMLIPMSGMGAVQASSAAPSISKVMSASAFGGFSAVAPGSWVEIYGSNLASTTRGWDANDFVGNNAPTSLEGVQVTIGNEKAFVAYVSPNQVNVQLPSDIAIGSPLQIQVTNAGVTSAPISVAVNATEPGPLAPANFQVGGNQYVVAILPDGSYAMPTGAVPGVNSRPAQPGEIVTMYGIGFGSVTPSFPAGQIVTQKNQLTLPLQIMFGDTQSDLQYYGLAPDLVGVYQFNAMVPSVPDSDLVPLSFNLGKSAGTQQLYIAVHQ